MPDEGSDTIGNTARSSRPSAVLKDIIVYSKLKLLRIWWDFVTRAFYTCVGSSLKAEFVVDLNKHGVQRQCFGNELPWKTMVLFVSVSKLHSYVKKNVTWFHKCLYIKCKWWWMLFTQSTWHGITGEVQSGLLGSVYLANLFGKLIWLFIQTPSTIVQIFIFQYKQHITSR